MGGRRQVFVLVLVTVLLRDPPAEARPQSLRPYLLNELASRCRDVAGEQAAADLRNLVPELARCFLLEEIQAEARHDMETGNMTGVIATLCLKKDHLLTCISHGVQRVARCFGRQEKELTEAIDHMFETVANFYCRHADDLAAIAGSQKETGCLGEVGMKFEGCGVMTLVAMAGGQHFHFLNHLTLQPSEKDCALNDKVLQCVNKVTDECKNSTSFRLVISGYKEVVDDALSCPVSTK